MQNNADSSRTHICWLLCLIVVALEIRNTHLLLSQRVSNTSLCVRFMTCRERWWSQAPVKKQDKKLIQNCAFDVRSQILMKECVNHQRRYIQSSSSSSMRQDSMEMLTIQRSAGDSRGMRAAADLKDRIARWRRKCYGSTCHRSHLERARVRYQKACQQVASWIPAWLWSFCGVQPDADAWNTTGQRGHRVGQGTRSIFDSKDMAGGVHLLCHWQQLLYWRYTRWEAGSPCYSDGTISKKGTSHWPTKHKEVKAAWSESQRPLSEESDWSRFRPLLCTKHTCCQRYQLCQLPAWCKPRCNQTLLCTRYSVTTFTGSHAQL